MIFIRLVYHKSLLMCMLSSTSTKGFSSGKIKKKDISQFPFSLFDINLIKFLVLSAPFSNISDISWRPVLVVEEPRVPGENHRSCASNW